MPLAIDRQPACSVIRIEGEFTVTAARELANLLIETLESGKKIQIDLAGAGEIDVSLLQLLCAAERDPEWLNLGQVSGVAEAASRTARNAGFGRFPGTVAAGVNS